MRAIRYAALLLFVALSTAAAAIPPIKKDMRFIEARRLLFKDRWQPFNVHERDNYRPIGIERELADSGIIEYDTCSSDFRNCILRYKRNRECLTVYTIGERVVEMKVFHFSRTCPGKVEQ